MKFRCLDFDYNLEASVALECSLKAIPEHSKILIRSGRYQGDAIEKKKLQQEESDKLSPVIGVENQKLPGRSTGDDRNSKRSTQQQNHSHAGCAQLQTDKNNKRPTTDSNDFVSYRRSAKKLRKTVRDKPRRIPLTVDQLLAMFRIILKQAATRRLANAIWSESIRKDSRTKQTPKFPLNMSVPLPTYCDSILQTGQLGLVVNVLRSQFLLPTVSRQPAQLGPVVQVLGGQFLRYPQNVRAGVVQWGEINNSGTFGFGKIRTEYSLRQLSKKRSILEVYDDKNQRSSSVTAVVSTEISPTIQQPVVPIEHWMAAIQVAMFAIQYQNQLQTTGTDAYQSQTACAKKQRVVGPNSSSSSFGQSKETSTKQTITSAHKSPLRENRPTNVSFAEFFEEVNDSRLNTSCGVKNRIIADTNDFSEESPAKKPRVTDPTDSEKQAIEEKLARKKARKALKKQKRREEKKLKRVAEATSDSKVKAMSNVKDSGVGNKGVDNEHKKAAEAAHEELLRTRSVLEKKNRESLQLMKQRRGTSTIETIQQSSLRLWVGGQVRRPRGLRSSLDPKEPASASTILDRISNPASMIRHDYQSRPDHDVKSNDHCAAMPRVNTQDNQDLISKGRGSREIQLDGSKLSSIPATSGDPAMCRSYHARPSEGNSAASIAPARYGSAENIGDIASHRESIRQGFQNRHSVGAHETTSIPVHNSSRPSILAGQNRQAHSQNSERYPSGGGFGRGGRGFRDQSNGWNASKVGLSLAASTMGSNQNKEFQTKGGFSQTSSHPSGPQLKNSIGALEHINQFGAQTPQGYQQPNRSSFDLNEGDKGALPVSNRIKRMGLTPRMSIGSTDQVAPVQQRCLLTENNIPSGGRCTGEEHPASARDFPSVRVLCSESFIEMYGDVVAKLTSGRWNPKKSERPIHLTDSTLVEACGLDIEIPGRRGIVIINTSGMNDSSSAKTIVLQLAQLAATGRYKHLYVVIHYNCNMTISITKNIMRLQCAPIVSHGLKLTAVHFKAAAPSMLATAVAQCILSCPKTNIDTQRMVTTATNTRCRDRAHFLLALVPVFTPTGAIQILHMAEDLLPKGAPWFRLLFQNQRLRQKILLNCSPETGELDVHPHGMHHLARILKVSIEDGTI